MNEHQFERDPFYPFLDTSCAVLEYFNTHTYNAQYTSNVLFTLSKLTAHTGASSQCVLLTTSVTAVLYIHELDETSF